MFEAPDGYYISSFCFMTIMFAIIVLFLGSDQIHIIILIFNIFPFPVDISSQAYTIMCNRDLLLIKTLGDSHKRAG